MKVLFTAVAVSLAASTTLLADDGVAELKEQIRKLTEKVEQLEKKNDTTTQSIVDELAAIKTSAATEMAPNEKSFYGMGNSASKVYYSKTPLSIGGYGEIVYSNGGGHATTDNYRFVPYIGYKFSDNVILNAELEFEHGGVSDEKSEGEVRVEFSYIDFLLNPKANLRVGNMLLPVGITNMRHEPTLFNSVFRPDVERYIIPTTWNETGVMAFGTVGDFKYQAGVVAGLQAVAAGNAKEQFSADGWISGGHQYGMKAAADNLGYVARLDYEGVPGLTAGGSIFVGDSAQTATNIGHATVTLWDLHAVYRMENSLELTGLYTKGTLSDTDKIIPQLQATLDPSEVQNGIVGKEVNGWYVNASYDLLSIISPESSFALPIFARYEKLNTQAKVASGYTADKNNDKTITTIGANFKPVPNVVLKADYQFRDNEGTGESDAWHLGMGFIF